MIHLLSLHDEIKIKKPVQDKNGFLFCLSMAPLLRITGAKLNFKVNNRKVSE